MTFRRFVLDPACEIAGEMIHPPSGWTLVALDRHWQTEPHTISVQSTDGEQAAWLTAELQQNLKASASDQPKARTVQLVQPDDGPTMMIQLGGKATNRGPIVHIVSTDRAVILQEALAAITAAWPD
jgi:hypothetical protein